MKSGSRLEQILRSGQFAVTGELGPPKNSSLEVVRQKARLLKGHVDAVNITDCQTAIVRMSSIAAGLIALAEGVEPVIQMTCRDRNRIGMQSDILGASALGLKNLLCLTGDHQKFGNHPGSKGVFDMDSIQLLGMMKGLRDAKEFQCGEKIKEAEPRLFLGAAANPFAGPADFRALRMGKKIDNGADFIQTQIVYNVEKFAEFMRMARDLGLHEKAYILAGVTPPRSLGMANYMKKFVPGMDVPDHIIDRLKGAKNKEEEGIKICVDIINQVKEIPGVSGVHIMAIEWESAVAEIVKLAGLDKRPSIEMTIAPTIGSAQSSLDEASARAITVQSTVSVPSEDKGASEELLAAAKREAASIIAEARTQAAALTQSTATTVSITTTDIEDAGEHAMNEKERQMALDSVRMGLAALKKAYGLSDDQFEALVKFAGAEAILVKEHATATLTTPAVPVASVAPVAVVAQPVPATPQVDATLAAEKAKLAAEAKAAEDAKQAAETKAQAEAKGIADAKAAEEVKKAHDATVAAEAQKAAEAKASEESKKAAEALAAQAKPAPVVSAFGAASLTVEQTPLKDRASHVPADHYVKAYTGAIREVSLGNGDKAVTVGGTNTLPFQLFEGQMNNKPLIAMDILDVTPDEWPETLTRHFADVLNNPVAWAQKCVSQYQADAICLSLVSTDPNGLNRSSAEAAKIAGAVISAVDVPIIIWGCGNAEKDTESLREITAMIGDKKVCLAPLSDANYRSLGATAMAFGHPMIAASPIDVNLAKQLNILLENLGVSLNSVLMDPSVGALGYGIEYTYSVMERIRLAALTQKDEKLQVPFICNLGREVWKAKECRLPSDAILGDQERRSVMMEAITASCMLMCGGDVLIMRHPQAISLAKALVNGLMS
jgi:CO dehydrogenase/acetyl-CoA synthase delta subunit